MKKLTSITDFPTIAGYTLSFQSGPKKKQVKNMNAMQMGQLSLIAIQA